jgi:L-lactate dehydrogenase complex protein LldF
MSHLTTETFDANARAALNDVQLRGALRNATSLFGTRRLAAANGLPNWQELRTEARAIKDEVLLHLDKYLEQFVANAESRGAQVHWARDAKEANQIIGGLANERSARKIVKSKSMVTEEIYLNVALENEGIEVIETDLGEYIIQLAGEAPSHIIVPAIHKTKKQIAELFTAKLGIEPTDDVDRLTSVARGVLRQRFAAADIGISGVNFGVAETGTILILENEGNVRLTTSLPKVHIAVMGIEKILPWFADLDVFLKLLPRSGTGQQLTTYQSLITGTKRQQTDEGPEELHIVLLDNGRSRMLAHPVTRQALACIRCGACLNACPVYQQIGGHAYGSVYPGPIGAVITPQLIGLGKAPQLPYASSLCGACREVCPVKIDIPELLLHLRAAIIETRGQEQKAGAEGSSQKAERWGHEEGKEAEAGSRIKKKRMERVAFKIYAFVMGRPGLYEWNAKVGRLFQGLIMREGRIGKVGATLSRLAPPLGAWTSARDLRPIAQRSFRELWRDGLSNDSQKESTLNEGDLFPGTAGVPAAASAKREQQQRQTAQ